MVTQVEKDAFRRLASLSAWDVAKHFGCGYSGDSNPMNHGGFFYDTRDWAEHGYTSTVEFWTDPEDDDVLHVSRGTVHKPDDMTGAFACCDITDPDDRANIHCQIDAAWSYCGIEPDGTRYPDVMTFRLTDWAEWRLWRSVAPWLAALGDSAPLGSPRTANPSPWRISARSGWPRITEDN